MTTESLRETRGVWATTVASSRVGVDLVHREGVSALMKGAALFSSKRVADWTTRFYFAESVAYWMRDAVGGRKLTFAEQSCASLLGGALSATATLPLDVLVATVQSAHRAGQSVSAASIWREQIKSGGVMQLITYSSRGYIARVAHVGATTLLMKSFSSTVYAAVEALAKAPGASAARVTT